MAGAAPITRATAARAFPAMARVALVSIIATMVATSMATIVAAEFIVIASPTAVAFATAAVTATIAAIAQGRHALGFAAITRTGFSIGRPCARSRTT
ncbi:hypothetical protein [Microvirga tunisiensis]|uniref:Uncharacterized protein n=1 Tax=Microvirga tunisiensis TaxID=2108360 RepID=A0A5N7MTM9_9HYPH|nr:hypothetical protein [Microvirga tunisiensis]MPR12247.1 hypothetical protein [Microvirga tunisiensis]MPR30337.1 hypothetical protein [Microvirga tunisiensis]